VTYRIGQITWGVIVSLLQILNVTIGHLTIPSEPWQSLPFVVTLILWAGAVGRAVAPVVDGVWFERSR
jgi:ABC-type uncharacterized transport system permease subunit